MNIIIALLFIANTGFPNWTQFQNTADNHGCAPSVHLNLAQMDTVFKFRVNKPLYAAPVIMGDTLYAASSDGRVIAINRKNGALYWIYHVPIGVASTPAADNGKLYVGGRDGVLRAINRFTGREVWRFGVDDTIPAEKEIRADIKLTADRLYMSSCNGKLYCLDLNGNKKWEYATSFYIRHPVAVKDSFVILSSMDEALYCLMDRGNACALKWVNRISPYGTSYNETVTARAAPMIVDTNLFLSYAEGELNHYSVAVSLNTGARTTLKESGRTSFNTTGFAANVAGRVYYNILGVNTNPIASAFQISGFYGRYARSNAAPAVLGNCVVFHSSFYPQGIYFALTTSLRDSLAMAGYTVSSSFAAADSVLYFGTYEGYIFGMGTGQPLVLASHDSLATGVCLHQGEKLLETVSIAPNPFNPSTRIRFGIARPEHGTISVVALDGRLIKHLADTRFSQGRHVIAWTGKNEAGHNVANGIYVIRAKIGDGVGYHKVTLAR